MTDKPDTELLAAAKELRDDLLMRGERDKDGTIVVNASFSRWLRFTRAIEAVDVDAGRGETKPKPSSPGRRKV